MRWNWLAVTGSSTVSGCHIDVKSCLQGGMLQGARAHIRLSCPHQDRLPLGRSRGKCLCASVCLRSEVRDLWAFKESCSYQNFSWFLKASWSRKQHVVLVALSNFPLVPDVSSLGAIWLWVEFSGKLFKTRTPGPQPRDDEWLVLDKNRSCESVFLGAFLAFPKHEVPGSYFEKCSKI